MKRTMRACAALAIVLLALAVAGCSSKVTFSDATGRSVTLKGTPKRIVSLSPACTETLFALGAGDKVVGVDNYSYWPVEARQKEKVGDAFNLNLEKLAALKPDLVILAGTKDVPPSQLKDMDRLGIPAYVSAASTVKDVLADIQRLADVVGASKQGKELVAKIQKDLQEVAASIPNDPGKRPKVLFLIDADLWTVGPASFVGDIIATAGGRNVVEDPKQEYLQISMEQVLAADPDVILLAIPEGQEKALVGRPGWSDLRAVKEGKVFFVNGDLTSRPGPSVAEGVREVAKHLTTK